MNILSGVAGLVVRGARSRDVHRIQPLHTHGIKILRALCGEEAVEEVRKGLISDAVELEQGARDGARSCPSSTRRQAAMDEYETLVLRDLAQAWAVYAVDYRRLHARAVATAHVAVFEPNHAALAAADRRVRLAEERINYCPHDELPTASAALGSARLALSQLAQSEATRRQRVQLEAAHAKADAAEGIRSGVKELTAAWKCLESNWQAAYARWLRSEAIEATHGADDDLPGACAATSAARRRRLAAAVATLNSGCELALDGADAAPSLLPAYLDSDSPLQK